MASEKFIAATISRLDSAYRKKTSPQTVAAWTTLLSPVEDKILADASKYWVLHEKFYPSVAELLDIYVVFFVAPDLAIAPVEAWGLVLAASHKWSPSDASGHPYERMPPALSEIVKYRGGLRAVATATAPQLARLEDDIKDAWRADVVTRKRKLVDQLVGHPTISRSTVTCMTMGD